MFYSHKVVRVATKTKHDVARLERLLSSTKVSETDSVLIQIAHPGYLHFIITVVLLAV